MSKKIAIVLGSKNDIEKIQAGIDLLEEFNIGYDLQVISAHRHPDQLREYCMGVEAAGIEVVIAAAGMAAALPGFIASYVDIPVIGVALKGGLADGLDALFSIVSVPKGMGLASTGVGKSAFINAVIYAMQILALKDADYKIKMKDIKKKFR